MERFLSLDSTSRSQVLASIYRTNPACQDPDSAGYLRPEVVDVIAELMSSCADFGQLRLIHNQIVKDDESVLHSKVPTTATDIVEKFRSTHGVSRSVAHLAFALHSDLSFPYRLRDHPSCPHLGDVRFIRADLARVLDLPWVSEDYCTHPVTTACGPIGYNVLTPYNFQCLTGLRNYVTSELSPGISFSNLDSNARKLKINAVYQFHEGVEYVVVRMGVNYFGIDIRHKVHVIPLPSCMGWRLTRVGAKFEARESSVSWISTHYPTSSPLSSIDTNIFSFVVCIGGFEYLLPRERIYSCWLSSAKCDYPPVPADPLRLYGEYVIDAAGRMLSGLPEYSLPVIPSPSIRSRSFTSPDIRKFVRTPLQLPYPPDQVDVVLRELFSRHPLVLANVVDDLDISRIDHDVVLQWLMDHGFFMINGHCHRRQHNSI